MRTRPRGAILDFLRKFSEKSARASGKRAHPARDQSTRWLTNVVGNVAVGWELVLEKLAVRARSIGTTTQNVRRERLRERFAMRMKCKGEFT